MVKCKECRKDFNPIRYNQVYCSVYCRGRANYRRRCPNNFKPRVCIVCSESFNLQKTGKKNYVCPDCQPRRDKAIQHESYIRRRHSCANCGNSCSPKSTICNACRIKLNRGSNAYCFKGNPRKTKQGYVIVPVPDHPFRNSSGKVAEHRLIMERQLGRYLEKDEIVHHLNGIKYDNRPQNLVVVKVHSHSSWTYIKALQKRIRDLEIELSQQRFNP